MTTDQAQSLGSELSAASLINRSFQKTAYHFGIQDTSLCDEVVLMRNANMTLSRPTNSQVGKFRHGDRRITSKSLEAILVAMTRLEPDSLTHFFQQVEGAFDSLWGRVYQRKIFNVNQLNLKTGLVNIDDVDQRPHVVSEITKAFIETMVDHQISFMEASDIARLLRRANAIPVRVSSESLRNYCSGTTDPKTHSLESLLLIFQCYGAMSSCLKRVQRKIEEAYINPMESMGTLPALLKAAREQGGYEETAMGYAQLITQYVWKVDPTISVLPPDLTEVSRGKPVNTNVLAALVILFRESGVGQYTVEALRDMQDGGNAANGASQVAPRLG